MLVLAVVMDNKDNRKLGSPTDFNLLSFNCEGFRSNWHCVHHLLSSTECDVLLLQEHWLSPTRLHELDSLAASVGFTCLSSSAMHDRVAAGPVRGRGNGGLAMFFKSSRCSRIERIQLDSNRLLGATVFINNCEVAVLNVYLPWNSSRDADALVEYLDCLSGFKLFDDAKPNSGHAFIAGDFNADFVRRDAICEDVALTLESLDYCLVPMPVGTSTFVNQNGGTSWIDHVAACLPPAAAVPHCSCFVPPGSRSTHKVLDLTATLHSATGAPPPALDTRVSSPTSVNWEAVLPEHKQHYRQLVSTAVDNRSWEFLTPDGVTIDRVILDLVNLLKEAATTALPSRKNGSTPGKPWWNDELQGKKESCMFWRSLWVCNGKPHTGEISRIYRRVKADFKYACRIFKRCNYEDTWRMLADQASPRKFWSRVKAEKDGGSKGLPDCVDGNTTHRSIADGFATTFGAACQPWNSALATEADSEFLDKLSRLPQGAEQVTTTEVINILSSRLKINKAADIHGCRNEHFLFAAEIIALPVAKILSQLISSGIWPQSLTCNIFFPLAKDLSSSTSNSSNYRGIAVAPVLSRVLEGIIDARNSERLSTSRQQYGYKKGGSCATCTHDLLEVAEKYTNSKTPLLLLCLDASKAFDKVLPGLLCSKLLDRKLPPAEVKLLHAMLSTSSGMVKFGSGLSEQFQLNAGVRQGSLLGGLLWSIYLDTLLVEMERAGLGCHFQGKWCGVFAYADDICLISPTVSGLRSMVALTENFASSHQVKINPEKSKLLFCGPYHKHTCPPINVCGGVVTPQSSVRYLGFELVVTARGRLLISARSALRKLFIATNSILAIPRCLNYMPLHTCVPTQGHRFTAR